MTSQLQRRSLSGIDLHVVRLGRGPLRSTALHFAPATAFVVLDCVPRTRPVHAADAVAALRRAGNGEAAELLERASGSYMSRHAAGVQRVARAIAARLGLARADARHVDQVAALHDIGKILVPDELLVKRGRLTAAELGRVREHAALGAELLRDAGFGEPVARAVEAHHERMDGRGYPRGLSDGRIPLAARIVSVADTLEVMTNARSYGSTLTLDEALAEIENRAGPQFDPVCVAALRGAHRAGMLDVAVEDVSQADPRAARAFAALVSGAAAFSGIVKPLGWRGRPAASVSLAAAS